MKNRSVFLQIRDIYKNFGGVQALVNVSLDIYKGEIVGLVGDNGAGKSTLIKVIGGLHDDYKGTIILDGIKTNINSYEKAKKLGIEIIYQELALIDLFSIVANIFLGKELFKPFLGKFGIVDWKKMLNESINLLTELEVNSINLSSLKESVYNLSGGERQAVAICRALYNKENLKLLILDEPTASLGVGRTGEVLELLKQINKILGLTMIIISHRMEDIFEICDRIIVLRNGKLVGVRDKNSTNIDEIVRFIVGGKKENNEKN